MSWWVVNQVTRPGGARGPQQTNYVVVQGDTAPVNKVAGPFATQADADNWRNDANAYGNSPASAAAQTAKDAANAAGKLTGLNAIGDFFSRLTQSNTWLRIGEGVLGIILIAVGIARMTHAVPIATKIAGAVA